jgi:hypothetical protein
VLPKGKARGWDFTLVSHPLLFESGFVPGRDWYAHGREVIESGEYALARSGTGASAIKIAFNSGLTIGAVAGHRLCK